MKLILDSESERKALIEMIRSWVREGNLHLWSEIKDDPSMMIKDVYKETEIIVNFIKMVKHSEIEGV